MKFDIRKIACFVGFTPCSIGVISSVEAAPHGTADAAATFVSASASSEANWDSGDCNNYSQFTVHALASAGGGFPDTDDVVWQCYFGSPVAATAAQSGFNQGNCASAAVFAYPQGGGQAQMLAFRAAGPWSGYCASS